MSQNGYGKCCVWERETDRQSESESERELEEMRVSQRSPPSLLPRSERKTVGRKASPRGSVFGRSPFRMAEHAPLWDPG